MYRITMYSSQNKEFLKSENFKDNIRTKKSAFSLVMNEVNSLIAKNEDMNASVDIDCSRSVSLRLYAMDRNIVVKHTFFITDMDNELPF